MFRAQCRRWWAWALGLGVALGASGDATVFSQQQEEPGFQLPDDALDGGRDWINTRSPIHLDDLRGKIVLLDFWTFCCINCHHVLPDLAKLEQKYAGQLVVIGVHTAKFEAEKDTENIRKKVAEYGIKHPVINDADQTLWNKFEINSWPTLVLIDPRGRLVAKVPGEGHFQAFDRAIGQLVQEHEKLGDLNETPLKFESEDEKAADSPLRYPGKITADAAGKRLFIADTAHHRIVATDLDGKLLFTAGTGAAGRKDGPFAAAEFHRPQGMCLVGDLLYVADTENHAIRALNLATKTVVTVAGTGKQAAFRARGGPAASTPLNSPWDLAAPGSGNILYIAMAGPHQILEARPDHAQCLGLGRQRDREHRRWHARYRLVRPAQRAGQRRPVPVRGRCRGLRRACVPAHGQQGRDDRRRRPLQLRRHGRPGQSGPAPALPGISLWRRQALYRRHL